MNQARSILYSFRRCPYAMRARMMIVYSGIQVELREVSLKDKPAALLEINPQGTVPSLILSNAEHTDHIIIESRDIMLWALKQHDPDNYIISANHPLIDHCDHDFKKHLDFYKYHDRFPKQNRQNHLDQCEIFLKKLENELKYHDFINNSQLSFVDLAIFPFIRQFHCINENILKQPKYAKLMRWLQTLLAHSLFTQSMRKYPIWQNNQQAVSFP